MNAGADDDTSATDGAKSRRNERADGGEDDRGVERLGRRLRGGSGPDGTELTGEDLTGHVAFTGEREDLAALVDRNLRDDVRGGSESVETDPSRIAAHA